MICPKCGYDNPAEARFCSRCGMPFQDMVPPAEDSEFLNNHLSDNEYDTYEEEDEEPKHHSYGPFITLIILLCVVAVGISFSVAWKQEQGTWPWERLIGTASSAVSQAAVSSSQQTLIPRKTSPNYTAADISAAVRNSEFQQFAVSESEINSIKTDGQSLTDADLVEFTVTKSMVQLHMQVRIPSSYSSAVSGAPSSIDKPRVTVWGADTWKLTGTWNDTDGNALLIDTCSAGSLTARYVPAGTFESRAVSGSISENGDISLLSGKTQISGQFTPAGTALLTITVNGRQPRTQQFIMLSSAIAGLPSVPSSAVSSSSRTSAVP